jgi:hypothetical protein
LKESKKVINMKAEQFDSVSKEVAKEQLQSIISDATGSWKIFVEFIKKFFCFICVVMLMPVEK